MQKEKNKSITVAFDCDGTLIDLNGKPRHDVIQVFLTLQKLGCNMVIWSVGGEDYAMQVASRLGLEPDLVGDKFMKINPDITFDDMEGFYVGGVSFQV